MEVLMVKSGINAGFSLPWLPLFIYPESSSNQSENRMIHQIWRSPGSKEGPILGQILFSTKPQSPFIAS